MKTSLRLHAVDGGAPRAQPPVAAPSREAGKEKVPAANVKEEPRAASSASSPRTASLVTRTATAAVGTRRPRRLSRKRGSPPAHRRQEEERRLCGARRAGG
jgi:hypothetical protein